jgi:prophage regulatory protein
MNISQDAAAGLPAHGYVRWAQLSRIVPVSRVTMWRMVQKGEVPAPIRLSTRVSAWRVEDVRRRLKRDKPP